MRQLGCIKSKRGQVTLFVIIGIILLVGVGFYFYLNSNIITEISETNLADVEDVEINLMPIKNYVEQCLYDVGYDAIKIMGEHGGYIEPIEKDNLYYNPVDVVDNDGVMLSENYFIPYWSYSSDGKNQLYAYQELNFPEIEEMEIRGKTYVEENLLNCLDDLKSLQYGTDIIIEDEPEVIFKIADDKILLRMDMSILIESENKRIKEYYSEIDVPFKEYFERGVLISYYHQQNQFIENLIMNIISMYGQPNPNKLPPTFAITEGFDYVVWSQQDVNNKIKDILRSYSQIIRFVGSKNEIKNELNDLDLTTQNIFNAMQIELFNPDEIDDTEISFIYLDAPIYTRVYGKQTTSTLIKPELFEQDSVVGANRREYTYRFYYDITAPFIVQMKFDSIIEGESPFIFNFALESNIKKNINWIQYLDGQGTIPWSENAVSFESDVVDDDENINSVTGEIYNQTKPEKIFFGNEDQLLSGDLRVFVYDELTGEELSDVVINVGMGDYSYTTLGITKKQENGDVNFIGKAPIMLNGYIEVQKTGYENQVKKITTKLDEGQLVTLKLSPLIEKNISIKVYDLETNQIRNLNLNESAILNLEKIFDTNVYSDFRTMISYGNITMRSAYLIPGKYKVSGMLIDNDGFIIPKKCARECSDYFLGVCTEYEYYPKNDIVMQPSLWGGIEFTEENPIYISKENLYQNNEIVLYLIKPPLPKCVKDLDRMSKTEEYTLQFRSKLLPTYELIQ